MAERTRGSRHAPSSSSSSPSSSPLESRVEFLPAAALREKDEAPRPRFSLFCTAEVQQVSQHESPHSADAYGPWSSAEVHSRRHLRSSASSVASCEPFGSDGDAGDEEVSGGALTRLRGSILPGSPCSQSQELHQISIEHAALESSHWKHREALDPKQRGTPEAESCDMPSSQYAPRLPSRRILATNH